MHFHDDGTNRYFKPPQCFLNPFIEQVGETAIDDVGSTKVGGVSTTDDTPSACGKR